MLREDEHDIFDGPYYRGDLNDWTPIYIHINKDHPAWQMALQDIAEYERMGFDTKRRFPDYQSILRIALLYVEL